jgi:hypothetical protein
MFRALETTTDNCSQVSLAVNMAEIVGVLLEEIGALFGVLLVEIFY